MCRSRYSPRKSAPIPVPAPRASTRVSPACSAQGQLSVSCEVVRPALHAFAIRPQHRGESVTDRVLADSLYRLYQHQNSWPSITRFRSFFRELGTRGRGESTKKGEVSKKGETREAGKGTRVADYAERLSASWIPVVRGERRLLYSDRLC